MLTKEQQELKVMIDQAEEAAMVNAIRSGCSAADFHLACSYPQCKCKQTPTVVRAAIENYLLRVTVEE